MFKNFIKKIAEAVLAILLPIITGAKTEITEKMDAQHKETMGIKELVQKVIAMLGDSEKDMQAIKASMAEKDRQLAQLKSQLDAIQKQQTNNENANQQAFSEIKTQVAGIIDNIPQELKEERLKQDEERAKKLLEIPKPESDENPDYDQMARNIAWQCNQADVIIQDDLPSQVIQKLLIMPEITVRFEEGHIVVAKKVDDPDEAFDAEAITREFNEKKQLENKLKYEQLLERQLTFVKQKMREQIVAYTNNPYQYEHVLLSEPAVTLQQNGNQNGLQEQVVTESMKANPMYAEISQTYSGNKYYAFIFLPEVIDFMRKQGMVMGLVPNSMTKPFSVTTVGYRNFWFFTDKEAVRVKESGELFGNYRHFYYFEGVAEIRLHILTPEEKKTVGV